jgi:hypothetical protein
MHKNTILNKSFVKETWIKSVTVVYTHMYIRVKSHIEKYITSVDKIISVTDVYIYMYVCLRRMDAYVNKRETTHI